MKKLFLCIFALLMLCQSNVYGQDKIIRESLMSFGSLNASENEKLTRIQSNGLYSDYYLAEWGSLVERQSAGRITIDLPGDDCGDLIYKATSVDYTNEQNYIWHGVLASTAENEECYCQLGSVTLISSESGKIAHIVVDDKTYELLQLSEGKFVLGKVDNRPFTESECLVNGARTHGSDAAPREQGRRTGNCDVKCLVLFTSNAQQVEGSISAIHNRANLAVSQTNQALRNSDVAECELKIELAGIQALDFDETNDIKFDINALVSNVEVQALRDEFEADIIVLLTDGNYTDPGGLFNILGVAPSANVNTAPSEELGFAIVEADAATARFTFAHEVGHLFGAGHEDNPNGVARGHSFRTGNFLPSIFGAGQQTIMHQRLLFSRNMTIQHYSNPAVRFDGVKTGIVGERDNTGKIRDEACFVAQYRQSVEPFSVSIRGDLHQCPCMSASLEASIFGGTAGDTYSYDWFSSNDGINWTLLQDGGQNVWVNVPCTAGDGIFVKVEVAASSGNAADSWEFIESATEWPGQEVPCMLRSGSKTDLLTSSPEHLQTMLSVLPNPTK